MSRQNILSGGQIGYIPVDAWDCFQHSFILLRSPEVCRFENFLRVVSRFRDEIDHFSTDLAGKAFFSTLKITCFDTARKYATGIASENETALHSWTDQTNNAVIKFF